MYVYMTVYINIYAVYHKPELLAFLLFDIQLLR